MMKNLLLLLFALFFSGMISAQNHLSLGLLAGQGFHPTEKLEGNHLNTYAVGGEMVYQLWNKLHFMARTSYENHYFWYDINDYYGYPPENRSVHYLSSDFGLQWKARWWYGGMGFTASKALTPKEEWTQTVFYCGVGLPDDFDYHAYERLANLSTHGMYTVVGLTPPISARSKAIIEFNYKAPITYFSNLSIQAASAVGFRLGIQYEVK